MALISLGEMLQETRRRRVAAPMFDVSNNQMIRAAVETAEEEAKFSPLWPAAALLAGLAAFSLRRRASRPHRMKR